MAELDALAALGILAFLAAIWIGMPKESAQATQTDVFQKRG